MFHKPFLFYASYAICEFPMNFRHKPILYNHFPIRNTRNTGDGDVCQCSTHNSVPCVTSPVLDPRVLYLNHLNLKYKTGGNSHGKCINRTYFFRGIKQYSSILFLLIIPRLTQDWRNLDAPFSVRENKSATFLRLKP